MTVRDEHSGDRDLVRAIHVAAFETAAEADLVDVLRERVHPTVSLVAEIDRVVVGHILFTPVELTDHPDFKMMGLAPMAVLPDRQRQGVGSALVQAGLERCRDLGFAAVVVLGHPEYYPRFGFEPAARFGVDDEYDVPEEYFMIVELQPGALAGRRGTAMYDPAFNAL